jgi:hypothetical protein
VGEVGAGVFTGDGVADAEHAEREVASTATSAIARGFRAPLPRMRPRMVILICVSYCLFVRRD